MAEKDKVEYKDISTLEEFSGWAEEVPDVNFFGDADNAEPGDTDEPGADPKNDDEPSDNKDKGEKSKEDIVEEIEMFTEGIEEPTDDEDGDEPSDDPQDVDTSITSLNYLKESGLIEYDLEEGEELTPELAKELIEDKFEERVEGKVETLFKELPDVLKELNKYAINGGNVQTFFDKIAKSNEVGITSDIDLEQESNQELVVRKMLKQDDLDNETIDTQVELLKKSGKLEAFSKKKYDVWKAKDDAEKAALLRSNDNQRKLDRERVKQNKKAVSEYIGQENDFGGFVITDSDKKSLPSYMNDKNIELDNGSSITGMQAALLTAMQDERKSVLLAKVLHSDFDFSDIERSAKTKLSKKVKKDVRRGSTVTPTKGGATGGSSQQKDLASYFD